MLRTPIKSVDSTEDFRFNGQQPLLINSDLLYCVFPVYPEEIITKVKMNFPEEHVTIRQRVSGVAD